MWFIWRNALVLSTFYPLVPTCTWVLVVFLGRPWRKKCFDFAVNRFCVITYMKTCNWFGLWVSKLIEVHYFILDLVTTDSLVMSDTSKLCMPNNLWNILYRAVIPSSRVVMHGKVLYLLQSMPFYIVKWSLVIRVISSFPKNRSKMHISEIIFVSGGTENGIREILK